MTRAFPPPVQRPTSDELRLRLQHRFGPVVIDVEDQSHLHAGHAGARGGAGHYRVRIESREFQDLSTVARHRLVYDVFKDWVPQRIHALSIEARLPDDGRTDGSR